MDEAFTIWNGITLSIAVLGASLGIMNTWRNFDRDRVKLRVIPKQAILVSSGGRDAFLTVTDPHQRELPTDNLGSQIAIEVMNLSAFAVTITEVGLLYHRTKIRGVMHSPNCSDETSLPVRLEPRTSFTAYGHPDILANIPHEYKVRCAYAQTSCDVIETGKSKALKHVVECANKS